MDSPDDEEYVSDEFGDAILWDGNKNIQPHSNGYPDSPACPSTGATSAPSTPRASSREASYIRDDDSTSPRETGLHGSHKSPRSSSSLISSLVSSVLAAYVPESPMLHDALAQFSKDDVMLLEALFQSLGKVCSELQISSISNGGSNNDEKSTNLLRLRLDAAWKVLDGQIDI